MRKHNGESDLITIHFNMVSFWSDFGRMKLRPLNDGYLTSAFGRNLVRSKLLKQNLYYYLSQNYYKISWVVKEKIHEHWSILVLTKIDVGTTSILVALWSRLLYDYKPTVGLTSGAYWVLPNWHIMLTQVVYNAKYLNAT